MLHNLPFSGNSVSIGKPSHLVHSEYVLTVSNWPAAMLNATKCAGTKKIECNQYKCMLYPT